MAKFRPRNDDELSRLSDEKLLASIALAYKAGHPEHAQRALAILTFRYYDSVIVPRVAIKVPRADVEDVAKEVVVSAIRSSLDGRSIGEFRTWLKRIISRRIADYHRKPGVETTELPDEHLDDERIWGEVPSEEAETGAVEVQELIDVALDELSERHRRVVRLFVFEDLDGKGTAETVNGEFPDEDPPMSVDNVAQIVRRFRERVRELLNEADEPAPGDRGNGRPRDAYPDDEDPDNP
ncbi:MAG: RNA polymerase sigma factor [Solirubrobacterales bacterium]